MTESRDGGVERDPLAFIPLRPVEFEILLTLSGGDAHGYGIIKESQGRNPEKGPMGTGTLYRALRRLTESGLVEPVEERPAPDLDDERRRYFSITAFGRAVAAAEARRLSAQLDAARARELLSGAGGSGS